MNTDNCDTIGPWSEIKLDILRKYANAYTRILKANKMIREYSYIDAFAGAGIHYRKGTNEAIPGSPLNALSVDPPFTNYHFIDMDPERTDNLKDLAELQNRSNVCVYNGDCNEILLREIFPRIQYSKYTRGLCLLDPYAINLDWNVILEAGRSKAIEIFINFMVMDMNMNILKHDKTRVTETQKERMNRFWGDSSWEQVAYTTENDLFGHAEKTSNEDLACAYKKRLKDVAGFQYVADPLSMRNNKGATVYYLFYASPNSTGGKIVNEIFAKHRPSKTR